MKCGTGQQSPDVSWGLSVDGHSLVLLIVALEDLLALGRLQQSHTGGCTSASERRGLQERAMMQCSSSFQEVGKMAKWL